MKIGYALAPLLTAFLLTGCAEWAARGINDAAYLADQAENYVRERFEFRQEIRRKCKDLFWKKVDALVADGDLAAAQDLLALHYPDLVTVEMVKKLIKAADEGDAAAFHDLAPGCSVQELPGEIVIE